jgi:hypothetical protein
MRSLIDERVDQARRGLNQSVICRLRSGLGGLRGFAVHRGLQYALLILSGTKVSVKQFDDSWTREGWSSRSLESRI